MRQKMTIQKIFETVNHKWAELADNSSWDAETSTPDYKDGMMFAYSDVLELLYQLEEVEHERGETEGNS